MDFKNSKDAMRARILDKYASLPLILRTGKLTCSWVVEGGVFSYEPPKIGGMGSEKVPNSEGYWSVSSTANFEPKKFHAARVHDKATGNDQGLCALPHNDNRRWCPSGYRRHCGCTGQI